MINKIEGPGPIRAPQQVKRTSKAGSTSGTSFAKQLDEASEVGSAQSISAAGAISGVLGVQEIDDALARAAKGKLRAQDILDRLDELRIELLTGTLSREKLVQLSKVVANHRVDVTDPRLAGILDEIDLRAQVELAKYDRPVGS